MSKTPTSEICIDKASTKKALMSDHGLSDKQIHHVLLTLLLGGTVVSFS